MMNDIKETRLHVTEIALSCGRSRCSYVSEIDPSTGCVTVTWPDVTSLTHVMLCVRGKTGKDFDFLKSVEQTSIDQVIFCHSKGKRKKDRRKEKTDFLSWGKGRGGGGGGGGGEQERKELRKSNNKNAPIPPISI